MKYADCIEEKLRDLLLLLQQATAPEVVLNSLEVNELGPSHRLVEESLLHVVDTSGAREYPALPV